MNSCLQIFDAGIKELLVYIQSSEDEETLLRSLSLPERAAALTPAEGQILSKILAAHVGRKKYIYSVSIISLYGLLERFVDSIIEAYVNRTAILVTKYDELPKAIVDRHTQLSLELAKAISDRHRNGVITEAQVIKNLHLCLSGAAEFRMNAAAFVLHRGNVDLSKITGFLTAVGIDGHLRRVSLASEMLTYLEGKYPERDIPNISDQDVPALFEPINSLVSRRNEIAHGVIDVDDIESIELLKGRCEFLLSYVRGLYCVVLQEVFKLRVLKQGSNHLGRPVRVFDNCIVCFSIGEVKIRVGDMLVAATGMANEPYRFGRIESLEVNKVSQTEIEATTPTEFGARVAFRAKESYDYFAIVDETL